MPEFVEYWQTNGRVRELTVPHTPQRNAVAERFNRTILGIVRAILDQSNLSDFPWVESVTSVVYTLNRLHRLRFLLT